MGEHDVDAKAQDEVLRLVGECDPEIIARFEKMVQSMAHGELTNSAELLERFGKREDRAQKIERVRKAVLSGIAPMLLALSARQLFAPPFGWLHYILWGLTALSVPVSLWAFLRENSTYLGTQELQEYHRH